MKISKVLWFTAGVTIAATATIVTRQAMALSGSEVMARGKDMFDRGRKIVEDASGLFERGIKLR
jgi:hypothetical protein